MSDQYKIKLEMIKRMFELLRQGKSLMDSGLMTSDSKNVLDLRSPFYRNQDATNAEGTNNENVETGTTCHRNDRQWYYMATYYGDFRFLYRGRVYDLCNQRNRAYSRRQGHQF